MVAAEAQPGAKSIGTIDVLRTLLAGPLPWLDNRKFGVADSIALAISTVFFGAFALAVSVELFPSKRYIGVLTLVGILLFAGPEFATSSFSLDDSRQLDRWRTGLRTAGLVAMISGVAVANKTSPALLLGLPIGTEVAVTLRLVGIRSNPLRSFQQFLCSQISIGIAVGIIAVSALSPNHPLYAIATYTAIVTACVVAASAAWTATRWFERGESSQQSLLSAQRKADLGQLAGWLHDEVSSPIRLIRVKMANGSFEPSQLIVELDRLDGELRLGQLEKLIDAGISRVRDVAAPYLRLAERHGVEIVDVPSQEAADFVLARDQALVATRTIAVLIGNALQAGTTRISLRAHVTNAELEIEVEDNAGGFEPSAAHFGRGLSDLRELLHDRLGFHRTPEGTIAQAFVSLTPSAFRTGARTDLN